MDGFWTVQFSGVQGFGFGVVTLIRGHVFGGDGNFIYTGTYTDQGGTLNARIHVRRGAPGVQSVMGIDQFVLILTGSLLGNTLTAKGNIPGSNLQLQARLTKQSELPR